MAPLSRTKWVTSKQPLWTSLATKRCILHLTLQSIGWALEHQCMTSSLAKSTMHELGVVLDFKESTIQIGKILLSMRDITNLQLKKSITRALRINSSPSQEPVSTSSATKRVVEILDAKYDKANIPAIIRENCSHLSATDREMLLSLLLRYESLFDDTLEG